MDIYSSTERGSVVTGRAKNERNPTNRLPHELLSTIFIIGDELYRQMRLEFGLWEPPGPFPLRMGQVCSHWRGVAISTPLLWDYIHIDRPPPNPLAALYLSRIGPTVPLDVVLELRIAYWRKAGINPTHWNNHVYYLPDLFEFLASNGAHIHRWRSLMIHVKTPRAAFEIIRILNTKTAPALRFFSCAWKVGTADAYYDEEPDSMADLINLHEIFEPFRLSGPSFPNLRSAELKKLPWSFVLERPPSAPLFSGLVSLKLGAGFSVGGFNHFSSLFSANPGLEELYISSGLGMGDDSLGSYPRIPLLLLRRLELSTDGVAHWVPCTLGMIDAPNVEHFALSMNSEYGERFNMPEILTYMATGRRLVANDTDTKPLVAKPMFPSLCSLDLRFAPTRGTREPQALKLLLSGSTSVCHLNMPSAFLDILGEEPWLLPNLSSLGLRHLVPPKVGDVLRRRLEAGLSAIQTVGLSPFGASDIVSGLPGPVRITKIPQLEFDMEFFTSDEEDDDDWEN